MAEGAIPCEWPLHVEVPLQRGPRPGGNVTFHAGAVIPKGYRKLRRNVYIASPELTFIQMAASLSMPELCLLGTELCATFVRDEYSVTGLARRDPVTNPAVLARAVAQAGSFKGKIKAQRALGYIQPNTDSPIEAQLAVLFALPNMYGGYGLPTFECNYVVPVPPAFAHLTSRQYFKTDFCWPDKRLAVEYDSDTWHTGADKIADDTIRRNVLVAQGYRVIGITSVQLSRVNRLDKAVDEIKMVLGARRDIRCSKYPERKQELHRIASAWTSANPADYSY